MRRSRAGSATAAALASFAAAVALADPPSVAIEDRLAAELAASDKTRAAVDEKLGARERDLRRRVRALYKLTRAGTAPLWVDERSRADLVERRAVARRLILRDLAERRQLVDELGAADVAHGRLLAEARLLRLVITQAPARRSLARPVPGRVVERFGPYRDPATRVPLVRRGIALQARADEGVLAPAAGTVLHAGEVRGLGTTVLLDHGAGVVTILGRLAHSRVSPGTWVEQGAVVGEAAGEPIYLEVRRAGHAVDPEPLIARDSP